MKINRNFLNLKENYLFSEVGARISAFRAANPGKEVIKLSIGDVTRPLAPCVIGAMHAAVDDLSRTETFRGYGPDSTCYGYDILLDSVIGSYARKGVTVSKDELFISDGAKSDLGNILDLFSEDNTVLVPDPVYPVYLDTNIMAGRRVLFADATEENDFLPLPKPKVRADIVYICSPNNPTGAVYDRERLKAWVDYANANGSVILFDAAYEAFVTEDLPRSVYEIEGARTCAVEICSFSKTAGFTGVRCGYTVFPKELERGGAKLGKLWARRQSTKFNGTSYISQMGAAAVFSEEGEREIRENLSYYRENAAIISGTLDRLGIRYTGGKNSPYLWMKCPNGMSSWEFFDELLSRANVAGTPGSGFGRNGEGFFRLTAFGTHENTKEACRRMEEMLS